MYTGVTAVRSRWCNGLCRPCNMLMPEIRFCGLFRPFLLSPDCIQSAGRPPGAVDSLLRALYIETPLSESENPWRSSPLRPSRSSRPCWPPVWGSPPWVCSCSDSATATRPSSTGSGCSTTRNGNTSRSSRKDATSARTRLLRNAILSLQTAIGLFVLASISIGAGYFARSTTVQGVSLVLFLAGMIAVFVSIMFAATEVRRSFRIVMIEVHAE